MKDKICLIACIAMATFLNGLYAQSAKTIDKMLTTEALTCGGACYLAGIISGTVSDDASLVDTLEKFRHVSGLKDARADDLIRYDIFANLMMHVTQVKGSIWYNLYKTPHYAFRYLKMEGLVSEETPPSSNVNPRDAMAIISKLSEVQ